MREIPLAILSDKTLLEIVKGWVGENRPMDQFVVTIFEEQQSRTRVRPEVEDRNVEADISVEAPKLVERGGG